MRQRLSRRVALTLSLTAIAVLAAALPAGASAARALYASGHPFDTGRFAQFGGNTLAGTFDGCSDSEWASALARTDFDVLIVGENAPGCFESDLSATTLDSIRNYVRSGRPLVQTGAHDNEDEWLNALFGFSTTHTGSSSDESLTATLQPGANGTPFAGGPSTLHAVDGSDFLGSTPGTTLYSGPDGVWVFRAAYGSGTVTYLAWDLCGQFDDCGTDFALQDDWYRVLDNAVQANNAFTIDGIKRSKKKGTATITVNVPNPGELLATGNGVKASSAGQAVISKSVGAGQARLLVKAKGKKRKKLNRKGKTKLSVAITYTPTAGRAATQSVQVKLKKRLKKK
jgi:hypothetical protein